MFYRFEKLKLIVNYTITKRTYVFKIDFKELRIKTKNVFYSITRIY